MVKRPARLQFTEDDLSSDAVKKAAGKADKAATKAEKAVDRLAPKKHRKLRQESDISADRTKKLRFDKAKSEEIPPKPSGIKRVAARAPADTLSAAAHKSISKYEDDNVGVQAAHQTELGAETAYHVASHAAYSHKLKKSINVPSLSNKIPLIRMKCLQCFPIGSKPVSFCPLPDRITIKKKFSICCTCFQPGPIPLPF